MGKPQRAQDVKLFSAITFKERNVLSHVKKILIEKYGTIDLESEVIPFIFTKYYTKEMGDNLKKMFVSFHNLIRPEILSEIKLYTNKIESQFAIDGKRQVNIDPGYLSYGNIVLATTKNYAHRIHLDKGIYGDVHLLYIHDKFRPCDWTYPDYKHDITIKFLMEMRTIYRTNLFE